MRTHTYHCDIIRPAHPSPSVHFPTVPYPQRHLLLPLPPSGSSAGLKRASSSPPPSTGVGPSTELGFAAPPPLQPRRQRHPSSPAALPARGGDGAAEPSPVGGRGGGGSGGAPAAEVALRELHVFCRAVRISIVDGGRGEVVLGSLEGMSMSVAATEAEVEVKFKLGSLQIDSHMPG